MTRKRKSSMRYAAAILVLIVAGALITGFLSNREQKYVMGLLSDHPDMAEPLELRNPTLKDGYKVSFCVYDPDLRMLRFGVRKPRNAASAVTDSIPIFLVDNQEITTHTVLDTSTWRGDYAIYCLKNIPRAESAVIIFHGGMTEAFSRVR